MSPVLDAALAVAMPAVATGAGSAATCSPAQAAGLTISAACFASAPGDAND